MASATLTLTNPMTNQTRSAPIGFSWTTLFFGVIVPLVRGDWKWAIIMVIAAFLTGFLSMFAFPFFYNKLYYNELLKDGFVENVPAEPQLA